jgi:outer membrane protein TolC
MKQTIILICGIALATSCQSEPTGKTTTYFRLPAPSVVDAFVMPDNLVIGKELESDWQRTYSSALSNNGNVIAAKARYNAALQQIQIVGAYPEPKLMLGGFVEPVETRNGPMQMKIGVQQRIPWHKRLEGKSDKQRATAQAAAADVVNVQLKLRAEIATLWAKRILLERSIAINNTQAKVMHHIENLVIAKFETGRASQSKVLRSQLATTKLQDRIFSLEAAAELIDSKIFAATTVHGNTINWAEQEYPLQHLTLDNYLSTAERPQLMKLEFMMRAAAHEVSVANDLQIPDFMIGVDYTMIGDGYPSMTTSGDDAIGVQLSFDLPFGNRPYAALVLAAEQKQQALKWQLQQATRNSDAEITNALTMRDDANRRVELYRNKLLPRAESTLEATLQSFQANQSSLQDVLDASTLILDYQLQLETAYSDMCATRAIIAGAILVGNE